MIQMEDIGPKGDTPQTNDNPKSINADTPFPEPQPGTSKDDTHANEVNDTNDTSTKKKVSSTRESKKRDVETPDLSNLNLRFPTGRLRTKKVSLNDLERQREVAAYINSGGSEAQDRKSTKLKFDEELEQFEWIEQNFTFRTCCHFMPKSKDDRNLCQCKRKRQFHYDTLPFSDEPVPEGTKWDKVAHTKEVPTNSFGQVEFSGTLGSKPKTSKFIRMSQFTDCGKLYELLTDCWGASEPNILISVIGGYDNFSLHKELKQEFCKGLINTTVNTGAWIVTGGIDKGVNTHVGDAVNEQPSHVKNSLTVIGFASFGVIHGRLSLIPKVKRDKKVTYDADGKMIVEEAEKQVAPVAGTTTTISLGSANKKAVKMDAVTADIMKRHYRKYAVQKPGQTGTSINPNHSHFLFVDDSVMGVPAKGAELQLRERFEKYVSVTAGKHSWENTQKYEVKAKKGEPAPTEASNRTCKMVTVVLQGDEKIIERVCRSMEDEVPVVVAEESGGAADVICYASRHCTQKKSGGVTFEDHVLQKLKHDMCMAFKWDQKEETTEEEINEKFEAQMAFLRVICSKEKKNLLTVFCVKDPDNNDFDKSMLGALMKSMQRGAKGEPSTAELTKQLILTIKWNRPDIAKKYIFFKNRTGHWPTGFLKEVFIECCLDNKHEFVQLLLSNGINLHDFAPVFYTEQLFSLVNARSEVMELFLDSIKQKHKYEYRFLPGVAEGICSFIGGGFNLPFLNPVFEAKYEKYSRLKMAEEKKIFPNELTDEKLLTFKPPELKDPSVVFFFWAVIMNYHEMAKIFWSNGSDYMAKALAAMRLYNSLIENLSLGDTEEDLAEYAADFSNIAVELLQYCYKSNDKELRQLLVAKPSLCPTHSIFGLAKLADHEDFIAHTSSQGILNEIWSGAIKQADLFSLKVLSGIVAPPLIPFVLDYDRVGNIFSYEAQAEIEAEEDDDDSDDEDDEDDKKKISVAAAASTPTSTGDPKIQIETDAIQVAQPDRPASPEAAGENAEELKKRLLEEKLLDNAMDKTSKNYEYSREEKDALPEITCPYKFYYFYTAPVTKFYSYTLVFIAYLILYTYMVLSELPENLHWAEIVLAFMVLSITVEELRQVATEGGSLGKKVTEYFDSVWNWLDFFGIVLFWTPFIMRFFEFEHSDDLARLLYIVDLFFWFMRILNIFTVSKRLGPVVTIIFNMVPIVVRFFFIWIVFMAAFGIIMQAVTEPKFYGDITMFNMVNIIRHSYWQTYGELFLENIDESNELENNSTCTSDYEDGSGLPPCPYLPITGYYFLGIYMVIGNVLLMNLLIAMFSSVYEEVNSKSLVDWKNKRMNLIVEYHTRPTLPPPFMLLNHLYIITRWKKHAAQAKLSRGLTAEYTKIGGGEDAYALRTSAERKLELELFEEEQKEELAIELKKEETTDLSHQIRTLKEKIDVSATNGREGWQSLALQVKNNSEQLAELQSSVDKILQILTEQK